MNKESDNSSTCSTMKKKVKGSLVSLKLEIIG